MVKQIINFLKIFFCIFLASAVFIPVRQVIADSYKCADGNAKWNKATNGGFECKIVTAGDEKARMTVISTKVVASSFKCEAGKTTDTASDCLGGTVCARLADCTSKEVGGYCLNSAVKGVPLLNDVDCQTYITKNTYTVTPPGTREKIGPVRWQLFRFRCPDSNKNTCWKPVPLGSGFAPSPLEEVNLPEATATLPVDESAPVMTVTDCCRQIVPVINYETEDYTLNHLVQTAINIYECILCIVGSLILIMLIFGAVMMMISAGNESMVGKGKQIISAAVIGGIIVFFSFLIVNFTVKALGAKFTNPDRVEIKPQG